VEFVCEAEKLGLDVCWVAEAWGPDSVSVLGHLAARTDEFEVIDAVAAVAGELGTSSAAVSLAWL
jgi:alkanesulfonate monooxygenase SsuD/methylene tetrahydromethanopterin reductase-like flavin-dependent oxidoreductase (luciferase family)